MKTISHMLSFENINSMITKNYHSILSTCFGDYMKLPPEEKRITHNPLRVKFEDGEEIMFDEEI